MLDVWLALHAKPLGTWSLSGNQIKVNCMERWWYVCTNEQCDATGPAEPK